MTTADNDRHELRLIRKLDGKVMPMPDLDADDPVDVDLDLYEFQVRHTHAGDWSEWMPAIVEQDFESDLHVGVRLLTDLVNELDDAVRNDPVETLKPDLIAYAMLEEARRNLAVIAGDLEKKLTAVMPKSIIAEGVTFERRKRKNRTAWDKDDLLRAVLDTRLFNPNTGEQVDPHDIDKVLHVWNLGTPRLTALRERNLDPDEFCRSEDAGWQIQVTQ